MKVFYTGTQWVRDLDHTIFERYLPPLDYQQSFHDIQGNGQQRSFFQKMMERRRLQSVQTVTTEKPS